MGKAELLADLRERTKSLELSEKEFWKAPEFSGGIAKGIVVELLGNARTEWLLQFFCQYPDHYIFWCERDSFINPTAIHQRGVGLPRIKFVNSSGDLQPVLRLALESQFYPFLIAPNRLTDIKAFQRLSLLAEKSKSTVFLLAEQKFSQAWPISLQLEINFSEKGLSVQVQRQKHGQSSEPDLKGNFEESSKETSRGDG
jgi:hypothetical protein